MKKIADFAIVEIETGQNSNNERFARKEVIQFCDAAVRLNPESTYHSHRKAHLAP